VQAGAFRSLDGALSLAERLRDAGFDPRVVRVPEDPLIRVRLGRFQLREGAEGLKSELEGAGFEAAVVLDAGSEERIR
jgi:cell division protein FtsN